MGSIITLGVGNLEIDWGKNEFFHNHSKLFLRDDIRPELYYHADNQQELKPAYSRPLRSVKRRLELLGYTLPQCRRLYTEHIEWTPDHYDVPTITFDMLARALAEADVQRISLHNDGRENYDLGEYVVKAILCDPEFIKTNARLGSLSDDDGTFFENLHPI